MGILNSSVLGNYQLRGIGGKTFLISVNYSVHRTRSRITAVKLPKTGWEQGN